MPPGGKTRNRVRVVPIRRRQWNVCRADNCRASVVGSQLPRQAGKARTRQLTEQLQSWTSFRIPR